jgi:Na+/pantothenate symporter
MKNTVSRTFNKMDRAAYKLLKACLGTILVSLLMLCIYLHGATDSVLFSMWVQRDYIAECAVSAVTLSFGGAFLLDWARMDAKNGR